MLSVIILNVIAPRKLAVDQHLKLSFRQCPIDSTINHLYYCNFFHKVPRLSQHFGQHIHPSQNSLIFSNTTAYLYHHGEKNYSQGLWGQCYKNTAVIQSSTYIFGLNINYNLPQYLSLPSWTNVIKLFYHVNLLPFHSNCQGIIVLEHSITRYYQ